MDVDLFIPCFIDQLYPQTAANTKTLLERLGCTVHYNPEQTCCGQPMFNSGDWKGSRELASKFLNDFSGDRPIVSPSGSCTGFVKNYYQKIFPEDSITVPKVAQQVYEISDFLLNYLKVEHLDTVFPHKVTFHDSCHALREYKIKEEPRQLLRMVEGLEIVEMEDSEACCGFGGTFSAKFKDISQAMVEQKVQDAIATGVKYIVTTEASCSMNIQGYISKHKLPLQTLHLVDVLVNH
ncbi:MAG: (Fe-S)-binding protein [Bacteroidales bacterium]|jgi:L-lactate dehydrogenase complex protein LldE|nr:(Fe-S)-binding protein [Bacteroidales bacterium]